METVVDRLSGSFLKVRRAEDQLNDLRNDFSTFLESDAYTLLEDEDDQSGEQVYSISLNKPLPLVWSVIVGEVLHDLRSALDHMIYELVLHAGGTRTRTIQFPILTSATGKGGFDTRGRQQLAGVSPHGVSFIEALQPYPERNPENQLHPLLVLAELSNADKHRLLHLTTMVVDPSKIKMTPKSGGGGQFHIFTHAPIEDRTIFLRIRTSGTMQIVFEEALRIAFLDGYVKTKAVDTTLTVLSEEVNKILAAANQELFN